MQTNERERSTYIEFMKWLLYHSEELASFGDFIINRKCSTKNGGHEVFEASWCMRFNHGCHGQCKSRILRAMRS